MDVEPIIDEIKQLEEMFDAPDTRPLSAADISAANRRRTMRYCPQPVVQAVAELRRLLPI
jgi:hypothetical protein